MRTLFSASSGCKSIRYKLVISAGVIESNMAFLTEKARLTAFEKWHDVFCYLTSYLFIVFFGFILFQGCQEDDYVAGTTALDIKITDVPGWYDGIQLHVKETEVKTSSDSFTIPVTVDAFNILDYQMGESLSLVENFEVPSERSNGVRLIHQEGSFVVVEV